VNYKIGETVKLKSGGPIMAIQRFIDNEYPINPEDRKFISQGFVKGDVVCQWFLENDLKMAAFSLDSIYSIER
jgi:uncharacterized protein YodC (DUF2158 family)